MLSFIVQRPLLFDAYQKMTRLVRRKKPSYFFFDDFSKRMKKKVHFIQIGANDGLRQDPIREFILRDKWTGLFVEPLPTIFAELKKNYGYLKRNNLHFLNVAIADTRCKLPFYTFNDRFLATFPLEKRLNLIRKSSFHRQHLEQFIPEGISSDEAIQVMIIPCITIQDILDQYPFSDPIHLLVIDAEGYEPVIIKSIDFSKLKPKAIFFEQLHLSQDKEQIYQLLHKEGYRIQEIKRDAVALLE